MTRALIAFLLAALGMGEPARASNTVDIPLDHVLAAVARNPGLHASIRLQLWRAKLARADVNCRGLRLDSAWTMLAGRTIGPYECPLGTRTVFITATQSYFDAEGRRLRATDPDLLGKAAKVIETHFKWQWRRTR